MINDNKTYGITGGKFGEVKGDSGPLTVLNDVFTYTQLYRTEKGTEAATLSYDINKSMYSYTFQNVSETYTEEVPDTVNGDLFTVLYNFVIWYRGTYNV